MKNEAAGGGSWLIEPVGTRPVFVLADLGEEAHEYARVAEQFVKDEVMPRLDEIEAQKDGVMPALVKRAGEVGLLQVATADGAGTPDFSASERHCPSYTSMPSAGRR